MSKTLKQLREELAARLGYGSQEVTQNPILDSFLQRSQQDIIDTYGSVLCDPWPAGAFVDDGDSPSVPQTYLLNKALVLAKIHYRQPHDAETSEVVTYEKSVRGFAA